MNRVIFSVLFIISFFYTQAQTDFRPGYVITNSMDTIHGFIDEGSGYVHENNNFHQFNNGSWTKKSLYYLGFDYSLTTSNHKVYLSLPNDNGGGTKNIYSFDPENYDFEEIIFPGEERARAVSFGIGNSIYVLSETSPARVVKKFKDLYELEIAE